VTLSLVIGGLTLEEIQELLRLAREIEQRHPDIPLLCVITGLEGKSREEAQKILREIFPGRIMAR